VEGFTCGENPPAPCPPMWGDSRRTGGSKYENDYCGGWWRRDYWFLFFYHYYYSSMVFGVVEFPLSTFSHSAVVARLWVVPVLDVCRTRSKNAEISNRHCPAKSVHETRSLYPCSLIRDNPPVSVTRRLVLLRMYLGLFTGTAWDRH
jgi:hypothetical protein